MKTVKTAEEVRQIFEDRTGVNWLNSQNEPDIEYVWWLENKVIEISRMLNENEKDAI